MVVMQMSSLCEKAVLMGRLIGAKGAHPSFTTPFIHTTPNEGSALCNYSQIQLAVVPEPL